MSSKIPPKFYQICRLCLAQISDCNISKLSIFGNNVNKTNATNIGEETSNEQVPVTIAKNFDATPVSSDNDSDSSDISGRIATCLSINVSILCFINNFKLFKKYFLDLNG